MRVHFRNISHEMPYRPEARKCQMCTKEKIEIVKNIRLNGSKAINRRHEVYRKGLHREAFLLGTNNTRNKPPEEIGSAEGGGWTQRGLEMATDSARHWGCTRSGKSWRNDINIP